jgi:hypothetical protein
MANTFFHSVLSLKCRHFLLAFILLIRMAFSAYSQNIGIGTQSPLKTFSVNGTIMLDQNNANFGTLDSAALVFGSAASVGIVSKKTSGGLQHGMSLITNNMSRINITSFGFVGINTTSPSTWLHVDGGFRANGYVWGDGLGRFDDRLAVGGNGLSTYKLYVHGGNSYFEGNGLFTGTLQANAGIQTSSAGLTGSISVGSNATVTGNLNVGNDGVFGGNFRVNGRIGVNGATNANYGLIVNNANSYFQGNTITTGNATVQGNTSLQGNLTIQGNGHVRSNGPSNLRVGFISVPVDEVINNGASASVLVNTGFTGGNADVRVMVSQIMGDVGASVQWQRVNVMVSSVADDGKCLLWLNNHSGANGVVKGTVYLTAIGKD